MKKIYLYLAALGIMAVAGCKKHDYAEGTLSPIIAVVDMKALYKGADVTLTTDNMSGAKEIVGVVISNAASGNSPAGILVVQNNRRNAIRGIAIDIGAAASNYVPGDSVRVQVTGATLTKISGTIRPYYCFAGCLRKHPGNHQFGYYRTRATGRRNLCRR
jgi:hypothetical protein